MQIYSLKFILLLLLFSQNWRLRQGLEHARQMIHYPIIIPSPLFISYFETGSYQVAKIGLELYPQPPRVAIVIGVCHQVCLFVFVCLKWRFSMLPRLALNLCI